VQKKVAKVGFDWPDAEPVWGKVHEELDEARSAAPEDLEEEIGDVLFAVVNLSRQLKIDPENRPQPGDAKIRNALPWSRNSGSRAGFGTQSARFGGAGSALGRSEAKRRYH
jgi:uncharacterized protein YabN with tetrapyrrole methylase and pyrophosphatase domain